MPPRPHGGRRAAAGGRGRAAAPGGGNGQAAANAPVYDTSTTNYTVMVESQETPIQADGAIWVDAASQLVTRTPFLGWKSVPSFRGQTASDAVLTSAQAVALFLPRCFVEDTPPSKTAADDAHPLNFRLSATAWSRIISVYIDSDLLREQFDDLPSFRKAMAKLTLARPGDLAITHADWKLGEAFVVPGGDVADAREAMAAIKFLSMVSINRLENQNHTSTPFGFVSALIGALGPCLTNASRLDETSALHFVTHRLKQSAGPAMRDGAMAFHLPEVISTASLPEALQPHSAGGSELMSEFVDALLYVGAATSREGVEEKRVLLLGRR